MAGLRMRGAYGPGMVTAVAMAAAFVGGCAELYKGPRVVHYTDTSFYVRHVPLTSGAQSVDEIAADICSGRKGQAVLRDAYQDVPLDIRYATYECI